MEDSTEKTVRKKFQKSYFDVLGLCCSSEVPLVEKILASLDGVKDFSVIVPTKTVIVVHDSLLVSQVQIVKALNQARLEANIRIHGETNYKNKWPSPYAVACGALLLLSFLKYAWSPLQWLAVAAIVVGIPPVLLKAVAAVRNLTLDINILVLIAVAGSLCLHDYWEAATIVFLFTIAEWLESRASHKATSVMSSLVSLVPQKAVLADTGEEINVDEVKLNTILAVKAGEVIPIDGVVVVGNCEVDEKILTGESFPVSKEKDSTVWASTINLNGYITVKTTSVAEDCVVARMAKLVEEAQNQKSRTQRFLDKCARFYTPAIVVISACLAIVPLVFHVQNKKEWYHLALVILVSGCPCALLLSTPVAMFCALSKAATLGVLFKGAEHLETLAQVKIMAFDKTGTITRGEFLVADVRSLQDGINLNKMLEWISSIESKSSHPMAAALVDFARSQGIEPKPDEVENFQNFPGEGICGRIEDYEIYIGNKKITSRAGCSEVPTLEGYDTEGKSVGYVFLGSSLAGVFSLGDVCRTGAKEAIKELKSIGIKTVMLTGDCHAAAKQTQAQLMDALDVIHSELLPEDKARIVKDFQKEGPTAMIGDGINDALALATADIGISMGVSGSALATESGDVVLMSNDIQRIPKAVRIAKKVKRKIIENVIISITTKAAIIALAIAGHPYVWAAVLTDVGTCLVVIFNSMLLLRGTPSQGKKSSWPSISSHSHQHKCKTVNGCSSHTHDHSSTCSDIESQKKCGTRCSSSNSTLRSCDDKKCSSSVKEHVHKTHSHPHNQASTKNHNCCHKVTHDLAPQIVNSHGCSGKETCGKKNDCGESTERHNHGVEEHAHTIHIHPQNQAGATDHHRCCQKVNQDLVVNSHECSGKARCSEKTIERHDHGGEEHAHKTHFHPDNQVSATNHHCCPKVTQDLVVNNHGCSGKARCIEKTTERHNHGAEEHDHKTHFHPQSQASATAQKGSGCASDHELHETKKHEHVSHSTGCKSSTQSPVSNEHAISSNHCQETHHGHHKKNEHKEHCHSECEKHASEHGEILRPCVSKLGCNDSVGSSSSGPGAAINKTHGGCCESFRRERCTKNGHLGTSFGGGLSEIVIEQ